MNIYTKISFLFTFFFYYFWKIHLFTSLKSLEFSVENDEIATRLDFAVVVDCCRVLFRYLLWHKVDDKTLLMVSHCHLFNENNEHS